MLADFLCDFWDWGPCLGEGFNIFGVINNRNRSVLLLNKLSVYQYFLKLTKNFKGTFQEVFLTIEISY